MADAPKIKYIFSAEDEDCLTLETMRAYQNGKLAAPALHQVERHLLNCELCSMAIEGIVGQPDTAIARGAAAISATAWSRVQPKQSRRSALIWMSAAASVILLVAVSWIFLKPPSEDKMQAVFSEMIEETQADDQLRDKGIAQNRSVEFEEAAPVDGTQLLPPPIEDSKRVPKAPYSDAVPTQPLPLPRPAPASSIPFGVSSGKDAVKGGATAKDAAKASGPTRSNMDLDNNTFGGTIANSELSEDDASDEQELGTVVITSSASRKEIQSNSSMDRITVRDKRASEDVRKPAKENFKSPALEKKSAAKGKNSPSAGKTATVAPAAPTNKKDAYYADESGVKEERPLLENITLDGDAGPKRLADSIGRSDGYLATKYDIGMDAYLRKDYVNAAANLRAAASETPSNLLAHLYAANSFLNIGQPEAAIFHLDRILAQAPNSYTEDAEWYKALAYLKMNDATAAKRQLIKVQDGGGKHSAKAKKSLDKL
jgi:hypothetical protein